MFPFIQRVIFCYSVSKRETKELKNTAGWTTTDQVALFKISRPRPSPPSPQALKQAAAKQQQQRNISMTFLVPAYCSCFCWQISRVPIQITAFIPRFFLLLTLNYLHYGSSH